MKKILVVDDNRMILHSLTSYLTFVFKGYTVLSAEDGRQAIALMESTPVSLILTDLEMPNVDGYQVIEYAKKNHPSVPVVIMTGSWSLDLRLLVCKTGIARCIEKPFRFEELAHLLAETLEANQKASAAIPSAAADYGMNFRGNA